MRRSTTRNTKTSTTLPQFSLGQRRKKGPKPLSGDVVVVVLVTAALLLLLASYALPFRSHATIMAEKEHIISQHWKHQEEMGGNRPPIAEHEHPQLQHSDKDAMHKPSFPSKVTGTTWVEGEKRLKQALKELADRQARGLDIGVPVLTRYLGPDVPAWPNEQMPKDQWQQKVDEKYEAMRQEENEWIQHMNEYLKTSNWG